MRFVGFSCILNTEKKKKGIVIMYACGILPWLFMLMFLTNFSVVSLKMFRCVLEHFHAKRRRSTNASA